jgi:hypothetical protein
VQTELTCTQEVIARLSAPETSPAALQSVLRKLLAVGQGSKDASLHSHMPALDLVKSWDVLVYVAVEDPGGCEAEPWGFLWELCVGASERPLWSSTLFNAGADEARGGAAKAVTGESVVVAETLLARVWFVGPVAELRGPIGEAFVQRLRTSHLRGAQSKVKSKQQDLRPVANANQGPVLVYEMAQAGEMEFGVLRFYNLTDATLASIVLGEVSAAMNFFHGYSQSY